MEKVKPISSTNTDYYQWGKNCKLLQFNEEETQRIIETYERAGFEKEKQEDVDLFWEGYHSIQEVK